MQSKRNFPAKWKHLKTIFSFMSKSLCRQNDIMDYQIQCHRSHLFLKKSLSIQISKAGRGTFVLYPLPKYILVVTS